MKVAFDLETHLIAPGLLTPPIVCGSFCDSDNPNEPQLHLREGALWTIGALLRDDTVIWRGANVAYDFGCVLAARPQLLPLVWKAYEEGRVFDVLIGATLDAIYDGRLRDGELYNERGKKIQSGRYSLSSAVEERLNRTDAKRNDKWRLSYASLDNIPVEDWPEDARQYPLDDALNTFWVAEALEKYARNLHNMKEQAQAAFCAHLGAVWGMRLDEERVTQLKTHVDAELSECQQFALEHGFLKWAGTKKAPKLSKDTKAIKEAVFKAYDGLPPVTPTGEVAIGREALYDSGDEVLEKLSETSKWEKLRTYADELSKLGSKPMNVSCNILVATGRASYNGLVQLMPRKGGVRECFVARPGTVWSSVDYGAVEMATLAQCQLTLLGHSKLADALNADLDPHSLFAAGMTGVPYEEFLAKKKQQKEAGLRQAAKAANFGFPGMMGAAKFVIAQRLAGNKVCNWTHPEHKCGTNKVRTWRGRELEGPLCELCVTESSVLKDAYLRQWPEMRLYWNKVQSLLEGDRLEQLVSCRTRGGLSAPAAANTLFQGLAADGAKAALVNLTREMYLDKASPLFGSRLMLFAHDETIIEIPEEKADAAARRQAEVMIAAMRRYTPDVKIIAEPALMRRWDKSAEARYDENKKLISYN